MARPSREKLSLHGLPAEEWGRRLRQARKDAGYDTLREAAAKVGMGEVQLSQIECGRRVPGLDTFYRLVHALELDLETIFRPQA